MKIGFIGLGTMGAHMAANLQAAGHELVVHDARKAAAEPHIGRGALWAESPKAVAAVAPVVFASLPGPPEVEAVALGPDGVLAGFKAGGAFFDLSTNSPTVVRRIGAALADKGCYMLDAPVSGGPNGARTRKLALWVGGDRAVFDRNKALLDAIGDQARWIGDIGAGSVAKLVHNCAGYAIQAAIAEVFAMGVKGGVEPLALWEAVRSGAGGRRRTFDAMVDQFLPGSYDPAQFALRLATKDVTLATQLGRELAVPMRISNIALSDMTEAINRGWAERDSRSPMLLAFERAGLEPVRVAKDRIAEVLQRDPPAKGDPKRA